MKKFICKLISEIIHYGLISSLILAVVTENNSLLNITAAAFWIIIFLACFFGSAYLVISYGIKHLKHSKHEKARGDGVAALERFSEQKNIFSRMWRWLRLAVVTSFLAYGGWVFTAVCYVLASLFVCLCASLVRDNLSKFNEQPAQAMA
ncbi:hypothetical protein GM31_15885 [Trabulsiella odontotermitis]|uniref:Uncharacterized protein n=2 Tax=Trabulsiella odontotermitis TaxID=379893 RepID=A0A0L0GZ08_9ENTR|nr:hypothetical protein GM31_15885 [Trabulsiella odontotermitis]